MLKVIWIAGVVIFMVGCKPKNRIVLAENIFASGVSQGNLDNELLEVSGLVESINNPGYLWVHNDSGDKARIFLIDKRGKRIATVQFGGVGNRDWEDITIGPGPEKGRTYVYVGDIGDNESEFQTKYIYRTEEPMLDVTKKTDTTISHIDRIEFKLPDGPQDIELLMLDPLTRDLYTISKRKKKVTLYRLPYPQSTTEVEAAEMSFPQKDFLQYDRDSVLEQSDKLLINGYNALYYYQIVGGDISADGNEVLIKSYSSVYYWRKSGDESFIDLMKKDPVRLPYTPEPQGEAIGFDAEGRGYYTLSEKRGEEPVRLNFYKRK